MSAWTSVITSSQTGHLWLLLVIIFVVVAGAGVVATVAGAVVEHTGLPDPFAEDVCREDLECWAVVETLQTLLWYAKSFSFLNLQEQALQVNPGLGAIMLSFFSMGFSAGDIV